MAPDTVDRESDSRTAAATSTAIAGLSRDGDVADHLNLGEEFRRMQERIAGIADSAGDLIISTDSDGTILTWNDGAVSATGFNQDEVRGLKLADQIVAPYNLEMADCFRPIAPIGDRQAVGWPMRCKSGGAIPVSWHLSRTIGPRGGVTGAILVGRNLIEQKALAAQMQQAGKLTALGMIAGSIAHEIRGPLGVSSAAAQLMKRCANSPTLMGECIDKVIGGIDRAALVVESLLRFARPGPLRENERIDLNTVLDNALVFASGEKTIGTFVDWSVGKRRVYVRGVPHLLELVIINLMLNSFQAMPNGGTLYVKLRLDRREAVIEIGDTGCGISPAHVSRIFDPFFTTGNDSGRSGLGLWISHSIVHEHRGSISVRTSGNGTVFSVRLPVPVMAKGGAQ